MSPTAREIMNANPPFCDVDTPIREIARRFADEALTGLLVLDEERRLMGVITEEDLIDQQRQLHMPTAIALLDMVIPMGEGRFERELERMQALKAEDLMSRDVQSVAPDADLTAIASLMSEREVHHLPVLDGDAVVGLISRHELIKALANSR
ncbi:MAG TPA: CBS domain-containing protein [Mariprofundaceae bacterium]|nr:CBS domain-containing protein [Mariprofundaceae bacterium]